MVIKVNKCSVPGYWYENRIGELFENTTMPHEGHHVVELNPADGSRGSVVLDDCEEFNEGFIVTADVTKISYLDGVANITVTYPEAVSETCKLTLDTQTVDLPIVDGIATFQFVSEIVGFHKITFKSPSTFGANIIWIEVI